jgi:hypothetical protein
MQHDKEQGIYYFGDVGAYGQPIANKGLFIILLFLFLFTLLLILCILNYLYLLQTKHLFNII